MLTLRCACLQYLESLAGNILRQTVIPRQQNFGGRIFDISTAHRLLRRTGLALALSAQLIILGGIGDLAKAEDPPSRQVISACRIDRPAELGDVPKGSAEVSKGLVFVRAAHPLMAIGAFDRATEHFDQSVKVDPLAPIGFYQRGCAFAVRGGRARARADFARRIELAPDPGEARVFIRRAQAYQGKRDYAHAINNLGQALKLEPQNAFALNNRCFARAIIGAFDGALPDCNEALRIRPNSAFILDSRAFTYLKMGSFDAAIADYDAALGIEPRMAASLYARGVAKRLKGDIAGSEADVAAAQAINPDVADPMALVRLG